MKWIVILALLIAFPCFAEEWNGYKVGDVYYDEYTGEIKGIVTKIMFLRGKADGIMYSRELYDKIEKATAQREVEREKLEGKILRIREIEVLERIADKLYQIKTK